MNNSDRLLCDFQEALSLPPGILLTEELKNIDDIFNDFQLLTAAEIIIAVGDHKNLSSRADILERAYKHGWHKNENLKLDKNLKKISFKTQKISQVFEMLLIELLLFLLLFNIPFGGAYLAVRDYLNSMIWQRNSSENLKYSMLKHTNINSTLN